MKATPPAAKEQHREGEEQRGQGFHDEAHKNETRGNNDACDEDQQESPIAIEPSTFGGVRSLEHPAQQLPVASENHSLLPGSALVRGWRFHEIGSERGVEDQGHDE